MHGQADLLEIVDRANVVRAVPNLTDDRFKRFGQLLFIQLHDQAILFHFRSELLDQLVEAW